ncbi:MAG: hypothetical protein LBF97_03375, partial [Elusimicrobiota bacterium]|nr:hypothetical protein [Elusimicrobiota bacterium]
MGFINTSRASLVAGVPRLEDGMIKDFVMSERGIIEVEGREVSGIENMGLDFTGLDKGSIVSRVIKLKGKIYGDNVSILAGNEKYDYEGDEISSTEKETLRGVEFAVDSSLLGGMYVGRIKIIASEEGFGVRTRGDLVASVGDIEIVGGKVIIKNAKAKEGIKIDSEVEMESEGRIEAGGEIKIASKGDVNINEAMSNQDIGITAKNDVRINELISNQNIDLKVGKGLTAVNIIANENLVIEARDITSLDGIFRSMGLLGLRALGNISYGVAESNGELTIEAVGDIENSSYTKSLDGIKIVSGGSAKLNEVISNQNIDLKVGKDLTAVNIIANGRLGIEARDITSLDGVFRSMGLLGLRALGNISYGVAESNGELTIEALGDIENSGYTKSLEYIKIVSGGSAKLNEVLSSKNIGMEVGKDLTAKNIMSVGSLGVNAGNITSDAGKFISGEEMELESSGNISYGVIESNKNITIEAAGNIENTGHTLTLGDLRMAGGNISFKDLGSVGLMELEAIENLVNDGTAESYGGINLKAKNINILGGGAYTSHKGLEAIGENFDNKGKLTSQDEMNLYFSNKFYNFGEIKTQKDLEIIGFNGVENKVNGIIYSQKDIKINSEKDVINEGEILNATENEEKGEITIKAKGDVILGNGSSISSESDIKIDGKNLTLQENSKIVGLLKVLIGIDDKVENAGGIEGGEAVKIEAKEVENSGSIIGITEKVEILSNILTNTTTGILNTNGILSLKIKEKYENKNEMEVKGDIEIETKDMIVEKLVLAMGKLSLKLTGYLTNNNELASYGDMEVEVGGDLTNKGKIMTNNNLKVKANNLYNKSTGQIYSTKDSEYRVGSYLENNQVLIESRGNLAIKGYGETKTINVKNNAGVIKALGDMSIIANKIENMSIDNYESFEVEGAYEIIVENLPNTESRHTVEANSSASPSKHSKYKDINRKIRSVQSKVYAIEIGEILGNNIKIVANEVMNKSSKINGVKEVIIETNIIKNIRLSGIVKYVNYEHETVKSAWSRTKQAWKSYGHYSYRIDEKEEIIYSNTPAVISGANVIINANEKIMNDAYQVTTGNSITVNNNGINKIVESVKNTGMLDPLGLIFGELGAVSLVDNVEGILGAN